MRWQFLLLAAPLVLLAGSAEAVCNTNDGNIPHCVNYDAVDYGAIAVCHQASNISSTAVQWAFDGWNTVVGKDVLGYNCGGLGTGIIIDDKPDGGCGYTNGIPNPACTQYPMDEHPVLLYIFFTPGVRDYPLDGQEHLAKHELGHTLGFDHEDVCESVMAMVPDCDPNPVEPTILDAFNYLWAYGVEAVTDLYAYKPSSSSVRLDWQPTNSSGEEICNEKEFEVWRSESARWQFDTLVDVAAQDSTGITLSNQWNGWCYRVSSMSEALPSGSGDYDTVGVAYYSDNQDSDCDAWSDDWEAIIGTNPQDSCGSNAWPPDFDNSREANVLDVTRFIPFFHDPCPCYQRRYDLKVDSHWTIDVMDVVTFIRPLRIGRCQG